MIKVTLHWDTIGAVNYMPNGIEFDGFEGTFWYDVLLPAIPTKGDFVRLHDILAFDNDPSSVIRVETPSAGLRIAFMSTLKDPKRFAGNLNWLVSTVEWGRSANTGELYVECRLRSPLEQDDYESIEQWKKDRVE